MIDVEKITRESVSRAKRWHGGDFHSWTILEWAGAMCGEAGEAANVAKKIRRAEQSIASLNGGPSFALINKLGHELADTFLYMVLVAAYYDIDLEWMIVDAFNRKSEEYGFPERIKRAEVLDMP